MNGELRNEHVETRGNKKVQELVRGSLLVMLGAWMSMGVIRYAAYLLRIQSADFWLIADTVLRATSAVFFTWVGARAIRSVGREIPATRIGWGRLLFGVILIYLQIRAQFVSNPHALQPDNEVQARGMEAGSILFWVVGAGLILSAFLKKKPAAKALPETSPLSGTSPS